MGEFTTLMARDGHEFQAWLAAPKGAPRGAVVVVQEIFGVNRHVRAVTDAYAAEGYVAIAPAMFDRVRRGIELGYTAEGVNEGRGYMLQVGGLQLPSWIAVVLSSFLFAAIHLDFHPLVLLNITLYAVAASFVALGQGSLWLVCGFHIAWNWVQGNVMGIAVSGTPREVALFTFGAKDGASDLLTGGSFGLEGSLAATLRAAEQTALAQGAPLVIEGDLGTAMNHPFDAIVCTQAVHTVVTALAGQGRGQLQLDVLQVSRVDG